MGGSVDEYVSKRSMYNLRRLGSARLGKFRVLENARQNKIVEIRRLLGSVFTENLLGP